MKLVPEHVIAARSMLRMTQTQLAEAAGITEVALSKFENGHTQPHQSTLDALRSALEDRGIIFINGGKPGVQFDRSNAKIPT